jgi:hypothetical protein
MATALISIGVHDLKMRHVIQIDLRIDDVLHAESRRFYYCLYILKRLPHLLFES